MAENAAWDLEQLCSHLRMAAKLEAWTIPYYMAPMFSIVDRAEQTYQLIQSVLHQEMLHLQLVANIANAYGCSPRLNPRWFSYDSDQEEKIPFLRFKFQPETAFAVQGYTPESDYNPRSGRIGPFDAKRINTMCIIEYPHWETGTQPAPCANVNAYDSIGQFYDALEYAVDEVDCADIVGGRRQVDMFSAFYRRLPRLTVDSGGEEGQAQVRMLLNIIRDQGEAAAVDDDIHWPNQNTADDPEPAHSHYQKFKEIREEFLTKGLPKTYPAATKPNAYTKAQQRCERILLGNFLKFIDALNGLFAGENPDDFVPLMVTIGANIRACWENGVTPKFADAAFLASIPEAASKYPEEDEYAL